MNQIECYNNLVAILEEEITIYRHFLDLTRHEHAILLESKLDALIENNRAKEAMILKLKSMERIREKRAKELSAALNVKTDPPRLVELASKMDLTLGDKLRTIQSTLELLIKRVKEHNQKNEILVQSALTNITGALENLKTSLQDKGTYKNEGHVSQGPVAPGRFVSKEV